jgi:tetrapyrrole methylase family protein/MazG family protein
MNKDTYTFDDLIQIIKRLRAPDGCSWDREQTPSSIRKNILEEAGELVEAIDLDDTQKIEEEAGDVLLQGAFVAVMLEDEGRSDIGKVITTLTKKLIRRHPHVFGGKVAATPEEALNFWKEAKANEKRV